MQNKWPPVGHFDNGQHFSSERTEFSSFSNSSSGAPKLQELLSLPAWLRPIVSRRRRQSRLS